MLLRMIKFEKNQPQIHHGHHTSINYIDFEGSHIIRTLG